MISPAQEMASLDSIDLFLAQASAHPDQPAVVTEAGTVTYAELARRVRLLAETFARRTQPRVMIALTPGADAYAAMLAAGLAGGFYTPVSTAAPIEKLRRIAGILQPDIILAEPSLAPALSEAAPNAGMVQAGELEATRGLIASTSWPPRHATAYVMFTSGSTGMPKGVVIPRVALDNYVAWMNGEKIIRREDRVSQFVNIGFDVSIFEIYGALCHGATLFPVAGLGDRLRPARMIQREKITVWTSVPSVVDLMLQARDVTAANLGSVRLFNFCGEPLLRAHVEAIFAVHPGAKVQNTYGPTEATVSMTSIELTPRTYAAACRSSIALGDPIPGMGLHLVRGDHPDEGEIVITGPQLATGYWQDPEKTTQAFQELVIDGTPVRGYLTGDWAERHQGRVYFRERIDFQVKVKGVRVELDEVAAALRACGWPVVCVLKSADRLAAVLERQNGIELDQQQLTRQLTELLDRQVIPEVIRVIDRMPRNDNGKIDRRATTAWLDSETAMAGSDLVRPTLAARS